MTRVKMRTYSSTSDIGRIRLILAGFFIALALPSLFLVRQAYQQLEFEALTQQRSLAEALAAQIDQRLTTAIEREDARPITAYEFLQATGTAQANVISPSPLTMFPVASEIPGAIGYFQIDPDGGFATPVLPADGRNPGFGSADYDARRALYERLHDLLSTNRLVQAAPAKDLVAGAALADAAGVRNAPAAGFGEAKAVGNDAGAKKMERVESEAVAAKLSVGAVQSVHLATESTAAPAPATPELAPEATAAAPPSAASRQVAIGQYEVGKRAIAKQAAFDALSEADSDRRRDARRDSVSANSTLDDKRQAASSFEAQAVRNYESRDAYSVPLERRARKEQALVPEIEFKSDAVAMPVAQFRVRTFESEIDPLTFAELSSGHFVLFRKVWRDRERYIQGLLFERQPFLDALVGMPTRASAFVASGTVDLDYRGRSLGRYGTAPAFGQSPTLVYRQQASAPLEGITMAFYTHDLRAGAGATVLGWTAAVLGAVLIGGFVLLYRLSVRQLRLVQQQQDFVSAVTHELKTPLTSIRMYGEILRAGWADEAKKRSYYEFIFEESERLSRLVGNVLELARLTRNRERLELRAQPIGTLIDTLRSKLATQVERAGFVLDLHCTEAAAGRSIAVDPDSFVQVFINLTDNAIKFAAEASDKRIEIRCELDGGTQARFRVRDFGPGVPAAHKSRIFELFYRPADATTQAKPGTGIGLALVRQLARAMNARVSVENRIPGAEFSVVFPLVS